MTRATSGPKREAGQQRFAGHAPGSVWARWRAVRRLVQVLSLGLFLFLLSASLQRPALLAQAALYFRLDPLMALAAMVADRAWLPGLGLALGTLLLTMLVGRVWCGWLCPLGTVLEWTSPRSARQRAQHLSPRWRMVKHWLLALLVAGAFFGNLTLVALDPLAILLRTVAVALLPALAWAVTAVEAALYTLAPLQQSVDRLEGLLRGPILPVEQPAFLQSGLIAGLLVVIVALNALAERFWCRYLCPLGALLGMFSRVALLRPVIGRACHRCGHCDTVCPLGAVDAARDYTVVAAECTLCLDCLAECPEQGGGLRLRLWPEPAREYDLSRRHLLGALGAGALGTALLRTEASTKARHPLLLRPPGVEDEAAFVSRCLRCGACLKVCPTSGLQPVLLEAGLEGIWTPRLVPRLGYCDYGCNACGQVCPSGAIPPLDLETKRGRVIGLAAVDRNRCLPWAYDVPCIVCEEMCPVPEKAISLEEVTVIGPGGNPIALQRPHVRQELCVGCGICEKRCPMEGQAAIRVYRYR